MRTLFRMVMCGIGLAAILLSLLPASIGSAASHKAGMGPNGEVPQPGVSSLVVEQFAAGALISRADAEFVLGGGGKALADFAADLNSDSRFGAVWVEYSPFSVHFRMTQFAPDLSRRLANVLGREPKVSLGGMSSREFRNVEVQVSKLFESARRRAGHKLLVETESDSRSGQIAIRVNPSDRRWIEQEVIPPGVDIKDGQVEEREASSYAGASMLTCTVGFAATQTQINGVVRAVVTAGHCPDSGESAYGYPLGSAQQEVCGTSDRQLHTTSAPNLWYGFFDFNNQWTTIQAVAGGYYRGQPFVRKGRMGSAIGFVGDPQYVPVGGGDCSSYLAFSFPLFNNGGSPVQGGDSGGPLMLIYGGQYYLAGITAAAGSPNNGNPTSGWSAWRDIPSGWVACTAQNPCN